MINIASSQPVHWPTAPAPAVAPVASVAAITPTQRTQSDGQSSLGSDRDPRSGVAQDKRSTPDKAPASLEAAPLLPRESADGGRKAPTAQDAEDSKEPSQEAKDVEAEAAAKALKMLEVLSTVWKASAAVVEGALGIQSRAANGGHVQGADATGQKSGGMAMSGQILAQGRGGDVSDASPAGNDPLLGRAAGDPVAYTEHGVSAWMAMEPGQLLRKKA